jgi:multidrug resistance efflux pump
LRQALTQQELAQARYDDDAKLVERGVVAANRLERRQANLDSARATVDANRAQVASEEVELSATTEEGVIAKVAEAEVRLEQAQWNLDQTTVTAPGDGFVTNLALSQGQRVTNMPFAPAMAFVDTSEKVLAAEIHQIYLRHVEAGQPVEITMKTLPGLLITGTVDVVIPAASQGQLLVSGTLAAFGEIQAEPFLVRIALDDPTILDGLLPGSVGNVAIYTSNVPATHVIRKVMIRMTAIMNYLNPAL